AGLLHHGLAHRRRTRPCGRHHPGRVCADQAEPAADGSGDVSKENRMIKVTVVYPYTEGARFDHGYYRDRHMPMVKARLGNACSYYTVEKGLGGREPGSPPAFVAMCAFICDSAEG